MQRLVLELTLARHGQLFLVTVRRAVPLPVGRVRQQEPALAQPGQPWRGGPALGSKVVGVSLDKVAKRIADQHQYSRMAGDPLTAAGFAVAIFFTVPGRRCRGQYLLRVADREAPQAQVFHRRCNL